VRRRPPRPPLNSGLDRVGPFHPYLAYLAVLLLDLAGVILLVAGTIALTDWIEDWF